MAVDDEAYKTLIDVADEADAVAKEQRHVARQARQAARQVQRGSSWTQLVDSGAMRIVWKRLGEGAVRLAHTAGTVRAVVARALVLEGLTTRQIGERFGISHQRVSSLLSRDRS